MKRRGKVWGYSFLVVALVMLAWVAVPSAQEATITVTSTADSGPGTLRKALTTGVSGDVIVFDPAVFPPDVPATIALTSQLPDITQGNLTIDASNAGVIIDGSALGSGDGFHITSNGNVIKGLQILYFPGNGVRIDSGASHNLIGGNTPDDRNVISGNGEFGATIADTGTANNTISGNYIGTDATGTAAIPNDGDGIVISDGASNNLIGGSNATPGGACTGECNLISGNGEFGVVIAGTGTANNTISGNYIGTNVNGSGPLGGNALAGIQINDGAQYNLIGGNTSGERNVISGNQFLGVGLLNGANHNKVQGNYIGTDVTGRVPIGNGCDGISINLGAHNNLIGGNNSTLGGRCSGECNLISGNDGSGIEIESNGTDYNVVSGNYIGTDVDGTTALGNVLHGVGIGEGAQQNVIGGTTDGERNVISGNDAVGVEIEGGGTNQNRVIGNYIGTNASGTAGVGNTMAGVEIHDGAQRNAIGGNNVIAYNDQAGVLIHGSSTLYNTISRNSIHSNSGVGICNEVGGNAELSPPSLTSVTANTVSGSAPVAAATVEVFSDDAYEGRVYEGSTTADASGNWTFAKGSPFQEPHVTATATDLQGNTSEFSIPKPFAPTFFTDASESAGIGVRGQRGVAWGDYNNDGYVDLFVTNRNVLYHNNGDGTFTDITAEAGGLWWGGEGVAWGDYDNDGDLDLYTSDWTNGDSLYSNEGDGTFTDVTAQAGLRDPGHGQTVAWGDYDNDGDLDLYIANSEEDPNLLYRNEGNGTFTDVTDQAQVTSTGYNSGVAWGDYDNDGDLDLYVTNSGTNHLFQNQGNGLFVHRAAELGVTAATYGGRHGVAWGDYDNDGDLDLTISAEGTAVLFRNDGEPFTDVTASAGLDSAGIGGQGVAWGDYDNDGWLDLYVTSDDGSALYHNNGDGTFTDVTIAAGVASGSDNWGAAWGDCDNDGDLDQYCPDKTTRS